MHLITSGTFLPAEFSTEVGLLPPSFLPLANKRLYEHQVNFLRNSLNIENIFLSLPNSFKLTEYEEQSLENLGIKVIWVDENLSLAESILECINSLENEPSQLTILHGDTLFMDTKYPVGDFISIHKNKGFYERASFVENSSELELRDIWPQEGESVVSGYFSFNFPKLFRERLEEKKNFVEALNEYNKTNPFNILSQGDWLDFGHINSFYQSRALLTTERSFNDLFIDKKIVKKSSEDKPSKIFAEANWFNELPLPLRRFIPSLLGFDRGDASFMNSYYETEYLYHLPLSDLYSFCNLNESKWKQIFLSIQELLNLFSKYKNKGVINGKEYVQLYLKNTLNRLEAFEEQSGISISDIKFSYSGKPGKLSLREIAVLTSDHISSDVQIEESIIHGDFCFSNLIFDSRSESIKCIDPRGQDLNGNITLYGDKRYDYAKLFHSVVGLYDLIISGQYNLHEENKEYFLEFFQTNLDSESIKLEFDRTILMPSGINKKEIHALTILLFLSMLPLHSDYPARQKAFIANSLRLFHDLNSNR
ncbi:MAG: hypothetical protein CMG64_07710 [Candidatus Marinimicrobia bacterium]|nr:hypothetical protein [Candidatus Neomarinimicrobiota bacterium]|tara:strand:+ start:7133 stop:8740 length:1608 start_codon:yes stop_codon:yes gene_type:complete